MKKLVLSLLIGSFAIAGFSQKNDMAELHKGAYIEFDKKVHDYGTIEHKGNGKCTFTLTNKGKKPLILNNVRSSCGCTAANWPKKPIPSGESRKITVNYDTRRLGSFTKSITVYNNGQKSPIKLQIKGTVKRNKE